jgi:hypothetical protein
MITNSPSRIVAQFRHIVTDYQTVKGFCKTLFATNFLQHQMSWWSDFEIVFCNCSNNIS